MKSSGCDETRIVAGKKLTGSSSRIVEIVHSIVNMVWPDFLSVHNRFGFNYSIMLLYHADLNMDKKTYEAKKRSHTTQGTRTWTCRWLRSGACEYWRALHAHDLGRAGNDGLMIYCLEASSPRMNMSTNLNGNAASDEFRERIKNQIRP
jgi:hypothetical protein